MPAQQRAIIMVGNPSEGYTFVGPFDSWDEASTHADRYLSHLTTWIVSLLRTDPYHPHVSFVPCGEECRE